MPFRLGPWVPSPHLAVSISSRENHKRRNGKEYLHYALLFESEGQSFPVKVWGEKEYVSQIEGSHGGVVHGFSLKLGL